MRVRKLGIASVIVATIALSGTSVASAQGTQPSSSDQLGTKGSALAIEHLFSPPAVLDQAWARAVEAVLDGVKRLVDAQRIEAVQALGGAPTILGPARERAPTILGPARERAPTILGPARERAPTPPVERAGFTAGDARLRSVAAWRAAWTPATAVREALATERVQPTPVPIEPPTEAGVDTRGEHAVLLGATMELPWLVP